MPATDHVPLPDPSPPAAPSTPASPLPAEWQRLRRYAGGALLILCFALFGWQAWRGRDPAPVTVQPLVQPGGVEIRVQVAGAVANPGVYRLAPGDRVEDAVRAAGGFAPDADTARVNLAQRVRDEQRLDIPASGQAPAGEGPAGAPAAAAAGPGALPPSGAGGVTPAGGPGWSGSGDRPNDRVNVNTASTAELEALPGIGPVTARRIVDYRENQGPIRSLQQLREAGISEPLLRRAAGRLAFE
jgi:competence ComEA-like helix-hairpin-helix protein